MNAPILSRRRFLSASLVAGGGLLFDLNIPLAGAAEGAQTLFNRPAVARRRSDEPKSSFIIRVSRANKDVLTRLTAELGAPSRNALCTAAYDAYLPKL